MFESGQFELRSRRQRTEDRTQEVTQRIKRFRSEKSEQNLELVVSRTSCLKDHLLQKNYFKQSKQ